MSLKIERFVNELMSSNCYLVVDEISKHCLCIDPASEKSLREIEYIETHGLKLDYIILTHEHTDHTWGVNALIDAFPNVKVVCSSYCQKVLPQEAKTYFRFYYDNLEYTYHVKRVDMTTEDIDWKLNWCGYTLNFISTPGHSRGSIIIGVDGSLFGGDTLMPFKPFIKKRNGGIRDQLVKSVKLIREIFPAETIVYPGHGESMSLDRIVSYVN